jgi:hypothetical protein
MKLIFLCILIFIKMDMNNDSPNKIYQILNQDKVNGIMNEASNLTSASHLQN